MSDVPPAPTDDDGALHDARRATVFVTEWRRLACLAKLPNPAAEPERTVRDLAVRLRTRGAPPTNPMFTGGPSPADLEPRADLSRQPLLSKLRHSRGVGLPAVTAGAVGPFAAVLAAACLDPSS